MKRDEIREWLTSEGVAEPSDIEGCSEGELTKLQQDLHGYLPASYKEFLRAVGHRAGRLLEGTEAFYRHLGTLNGDARDLLAEKGLQDSLPGDAFVFYMHQGYEFGYFRLKDGDDPPVYQYTEGSGPPEAAWPSFTEYLNDIVRMHRSKV